MNKNLCCLSVSIFILLLASSAEATITWIQEPDMPTGRDGLGIGVVNGIVYCIGGWTAGSPSSATGVVEAYDPVLNTWTTKAPMPTPRGFLAVCVMDNEIYALGGWNNSSNALTTAEVYDPSSNIWSTIAPMQAGRNGLGAEAVNGKVYAIGGFFNGENIVEEYDTSSNSWTYKTPMPGDRYFFASEVINDKIYVAAGRGPGGNYQPTWEYDPSANTWQIKANIPTTRYHPEAGVVNGKMYVCGGLNGTDIACGSLGNRTRAEVATVEVYDPISDSWSTEDPMLFARRELDVGVLGNKLYAIGGWPSSVCFINEEGEVAVGIKDGQAPVSIRDNGYQTTIISGPLLLPEGKECRVYDITGREVNPQQLAPGIYFVEIDGKITNKVVKVR